MQYNRILTDKDREEYKPIIDLMYKLLPMSGHKIHDAMVQEAFVFMEAVRLSNRTARIVSAGSYHDVAAELLRYNGYAVYDVDPVINYDLRTFCQLLGVTEVYDTIISTSVLEHTGNDIEFIIDCCNLLKAGGICVMTMDFKDDWRIGQPVPYTSNRFYTRESLNSLRATIQGYGCFLIDEPDWTAQDRFIWDGINYSFATFVFRKEQA